MSNLRPGDELLSPVGKPYDTLEEVIGIRPSKGSLAEYGITYRQVDLLATDEAVIEAGMQRIRIMSFSYAVSAFMDASLAASRGIGKTIVPTIIIILGSCVFRIVWVYTVFVYFHTIPGLYLLYFFSWVITAIAEIIYFAVSYRKLTIR